MKIYKPITLWDKIHNSVVDLSDTDTPERFGSMTDKEIVDELIRLAHHYRLECNRLTAEIEELTWQ